MTGTDAGTGSPGIALVGCGVVSRWHLEAYKAAGLRVVALCDRDEAKARKRARQFFPTVSVHADHQDLLRNDAVQVVDVATHVADRLPVVADCLRAGRHVLSQKPFADDLDAAERLCDLADRQGVLLAVNQNARWAPHNAWMREAVAAGAVGRVGSIRMAVAWDHNWIAGSATDRQPFAVLSDFAIHWLDLVRGLMGGRLPRTVQAAVARSPGQRTTTPLLAQVQMIWDEAQASLTLDGDTRHGRHERQVVAGGDGTIVAQGPDHGLLAVERHHAGGVERPELAGTWFPDAFAGSMQELLAAIAGQRRPRHDGRDNLGTLALTFAACASAASGGRPVAPGSILSIPCIGTDAGKGM